MLNGVEVRWLEDSPGQSRTVQDSQDSSVSLVWGVSGLIILLQDESFSTQIKPEGGASLWRMEWCFSSVRVESENIFQHRVSLWCHSVRLLTHSLLLLTLIHRWDSSVKTSESTSGVCPGFPPEKWFRNRSSSSETLQDTLLIDSLVHFVIFCSQQHLMYWSCDGVVTWAMPVCAVDTNVSVKRCSKTWCWGSPSSRGCDGFIHSLNPKTFSLFATSKHFQWSQIFGPQCTYLCCYRQKHWLTDECLQKGRGVVR